MRTVHTFATAFALVAMLATNNSFAQQQNTKNMKKHSETFMYEKDLPWEPAGQGAVRQIAGYNEQIMMVKVKFEKGGVGTPHKHKHTQVTYVASGMFEFTIGNKKKIVKTGDTLYMEPDVEHGCVCLEAGLLIDCFSPWRDDFLTTNGQ